ncbi:helix-turn-helix transcriptional regulator [Amycolatopsis solani]|uniref:helix-turn-helix transcriptional regulator n=1 Tax=Amycolatopsis solani TaxID=3028615 RepID=UPI00296EE938|nr:helix-turn-helix transcriptional regulator [Amycolatopsis sp. MEP2-6]
MTPVHAGGWPLTDRRRPLRRIADAAHRGDVFGVVVSGCAGMGKTRLLTEAMHRAVKQGTAALWGAAAIPDVAAAPGRPVLCLDDVHLLDGPAVTEALRLATSGAAFVLCTASSEEPGPPPLAALNASDGFTQLTLEPLSCEGIAELLAEVLGGQVDGALVHWSWRFSGGNPMLLRRLVEDMGDRAALGEKHGLWRLERWWTPGWRLSAPELAKLRDLDPEARSVAQGLALCEPWETGLAELVFDADALAAVDGAGLLDAEVEQRRHRLRLRDPLCARVLADTVQPLHARKVHRRLADALEGIGARRRGDGARLAAGRLAAGQSCPASAFVTGTWEAAAAGDLDLAERLAGAGARSGGGFAAALAQAVVAYLRGRADDVETALTGWRTAARHGGERDLAALLALRCRARRGQGDAVADAEFAGCGPGLPSVARAEAALRHWRVGTALELAVPHVGSAAPVVAVAAAETAAAAAALSGRSERALDFVRRGELAGRAQPGTGPAGETLLPWSALAHALAGRIADARRIAADRYRHTLDRRSAEAQAIWAMTSGYLELLAGRASAAAGLLREAAVLVRAHPSGWTWHLEPQLFGWLAEASAVLGDTVRATAALEEADRSLPPGIPVGPRSRARAWIACARGDLPAARRTAVAAAEEAAEAGAAGFEMLAWHDVVRLGGPQRELGRAEDRLARLTHGVDGTLVSTLAEHAAAVVVGDAWWLERTSEWFADRGFLLYAAEAAVRASAIHRRSGRTGDAVKAAALGQTLAQSCAGARTPGLVAAAAPAAPLTAREREIALLAAEGRPSRAIADRLTLSVRTVDNHLHRIYLKLGITGRDELTGALAGRVHW